MEDNVTVTIAIASYNNGAVIERCVDSAIFQTYTNLEILVVDDGSTDDTLERLKKYKINENVRIIEKENGGLSTVRQRGLDEAKGKYICFVDADDYLDKQYVERLFFAVLKSKADVCVCSTIFENEVGDVLLNDTHFYKCMDYNCLFKVESYDFVNLSPKLLTFLYLSDSWNKIYKTQFLNKSLANFCMPKGYNGTDTLFNQVLFLHSPAYNTISYQGYHHVVYRKSAAHRKHKDLLSSFMFVIEKMIDVSREMELFEKQEGYIKKLYANYLFAAYSDVYSDSKNYMEIIKQFKCIYNKNNVFLKKNRISLPETREIDSLTIKVFVLIIKRLRCILPLFFYIIKKNA